MHAVIWPGCGFVIRLTAVPTTITTTTPIGLCQRYETFLRAPD